MATLFRSDGWVKSAVGPSTPGASVYVCNQPANTTAPIQVPNGPALPPFVPSPLAPIFSDVNGLVPIKQPIITDGFGHYSFYATPGFYTLVVMLGGRVQQVYVDQNVGEAGTLNPALVAGSGITIVGNVISATGGGGAVSSVFGRTGAVVATSGDYTVAQITGAAPLASPGLTGVPTAPTAAPATNTTQIATTAFVIANTPAAAVSSVFGRTGAVIAQSGDYSYAQISGTPQLPITKAAIASNFLTSYNSGTGLFTAAQPAASDLSNGTTGTGAVVLASAITGFGTGTVTSVSFTGGLISVATPTTTPALTVAGTSGGIPFFSSTSAWASSALLAAGGVVIGGGAGTTPATNTQLVFSGSTLTIGLAASGTGILAMKGTTSGVVSIKTQNAAGTFNFNLPTTAGTAGQVLTSQGGAAAAMTWTTVTGTVSAGVTNQMAFYSSSTTVAGRTDVTTPAAGSLTLGSNGGNAGSLTINSATSSTSNLFVSDALGLNIVSPVKIYGILGVAGNKVLTSQFDKTSSTTLTTALQSDVLGVTNSYRFRAVLHVTMGVGGGCKWAIASDGVLTVTDFVQQNLVMNNTASTLTVSRQTTIGTSTSLALTPTSACIVVEGAFVVSSVGGRLNLQFAQDTSSGTPSSILVGSTFEIWLTNG